MTQSRYSSSELRDINEGNRNRLPPATTVYNMAMYELERGAENERLFHSAMFDLSELRGASTAQQSRIDSIERTAKACAGRHDSERAISLTGVRSIQEALQSFTTSDTDPKAVIKRSAWLMNELDNEAISAEDQVALTAVLNAQHVHRAKMELKQDVEQLRVDHMTVANDLIEVKGRVSKLEDLVRALTVQKNGPLDPPKMAQEIKVSTRYGKTITVRIPKGKALVPFKTSRSQSTRPKHHVADFAPFSQSIPEFVPATNADLAHPSLDTNECGAQPVQATAETIEKPLPPVPSASTSSVATSTTKAGVFEVVPNPGDSWSISAGLSAASVPDPSAWDSSALSTIPPAKTTLDTISTAGQFVVKSKGKGKAKKWTDPPIFQENQIIINEDGPESSPSHHDDVRTSSGAIPSSVHEILEPARKSFAGIHISNETLAATPFELKQEASMKASISKRSLGNVETTSRSVKPQPKQEAPATEPNNKRSFGEFTKVAADSKPTDENQPPQPKQMGAQMKPSKPVVLSSVDEIMAKAGVQKDNYVTSATTPKTAQADQQNAVPRVSGGPGVVYHVTSPAPSRTSKASESANTSKSVRRSAIRVKADTDDLASSTGQSSLEKSKNVAFNDQSPTLNLNTASTRQEPVVSPVVSPVISTAFSTVDAGEPVSPSTSRAAMSPEAPTFRPNAFSQSAPSYKSSERGSNSTFTQSLMSKMTPEQYARFGERMNNLSA